MIIKTTTLLIFTLAASFLLADESKETDYYTISSFKAPDGTSAEVTGITLMPDNKVAVCTRRGQIWTIENAYTHPETPAKWKVFAEYLHEPLGIDYKDGWLYAVQRPEVTRLKDENGDGRADFFQCVSDDWGINGTTHEFNFGSKFDKQGNLWCALCLTGSFTSNSMYRGWILRVNENGKTVPTACGIRSPGGVGFNAKGDAFYTDNQGAWNGSSSLKWVKPGSYQGNPNGNIWFEHAGGVIGEQPPHPNYEIDDRIENIRKTTPTFVPPAVVFPHKTVGNSPTGIEPDLSNGKFGPFAGQTYVAEQTLSMVHRVYLEKVNGVYQGAMFKFLEGFKSGNIGLLLTEGGVMFTGGSNRGWGAKGGQPYSFERVNWTGKVPFEIHEMRARHDGFEVTFTNPIDQKTAKASSLSMEAFTYDYSKKYGSPEVDQVTPKLSIKSIAKNGKSIVIKVDPMTKGHVHALNLAGIRNKAGHSLLHPDAYYTLNEIPAKKTAKVPQPTWTDPEKAAAEETGFLIQGEYGVAEAGQDHAIQVVALGHDHFDAYILEGGFPGLGFSKQNKKLKLSGTLKDGVTHFSGDDGYTGTLTESTFKLKKGDEVTGTFPRVERSSPTIGKQAPKGAIILFDGSNSDAWNKENVIENGLLKNDDIITKEKFGSYHLHIEFRTPYKPESRGQARGNSGVYHQGRYETQVLDSFGLEGAINETGGIYSVKAPDLNMCLPPLQWQTYDVDLTTAEHDAEGNLVKPARLSVKLNGVLVQDDVEMPAKKTKPGPGPIYLQKHGNPIYYRNIWLVKK